MITIKNKAAIQKMAIAGKYIAEILNNVHAYLRPGTSTLDLDIWLGAQLKEKGLVSRAQGYRGYKNVSCISINDEVVHGVPKKEKVIREGDLVKIDICASWKGYCADMARCYFIGNASEEAQSLVKIAQAALDKGIEKAVPGNRLTDISAAIQAEVERHGYGIVRDFAGHGIGKNMHEEPEIPNFGEFGQGPILRSGMTFAIEPMITQGAFHVYVAQDGWTVKTVDKGLAAHIEDTIVVTDHGPRILTRFQPQQGIS